MLTHLTGRSAAHGYALLVLAAALPAWSMPVQAPPDDMLPTPPATAPSQPKSDQPAPAADPMMMDGPVSESGDTELLRGPEVSDKTANTLVRLDAQGRFQRVEGRPDEAALVILDIEPDVREKARQAAAERRESLRTALLENLDLVIASTDAIEAKQQDKARQIMQQMRDRLDPAHVRDPVLAVMSPVLSEAQRDQLARLVDDYWTACIDWELRNAKDKSDAARERIEDRIGFELFQQEIRQAYERTLRPYRVKLEAIINATQPTDEQKAAIRGILHELIKAGGLAPTAEQQQDAARRIYQALDEERRQKLFEAAFNRL